MPQISVTGTGTASTAPDFASIDFSAQGQAPTSAEAAAIAAQDVQALLALLDQSAIPSGDRGVQQTSIHRRSRWDGEREVNLGWEAHVSVPCRVSDPEAAFALLDSVTLTVPAVTIDGPRWGVAPENAAHHRARSAAVSDARAKALSYAEAAGVDLGPLQQIIEAGSANQRPGGMLTMATRQMEMAAVAEPAEQTVVATVTLVYGP